MVIDFGKYEGPVFTGRPRGEKLRETLHLDAVDDAAPLVEVHVPANTYTVTSSFFLGLFGPSVLKAGSADAFFQKYRFTAKPVLIGAFSDYVHRVLQDKSLISKAQ